MKTWALARLSMKETIRSKTMIAGLAVSLLYLAVVPVLSSSSSGTTIIGSTDQGAAARDFLNFALNGLNFIAMIMAIFTTLGAIYSEVERGTMLAVVTKPVTRWQIIIGKWLGHVIMMGGYVTLMGFMLLLTVTLDSGIVITEFFPAIGLICLNVIAMVSVTLSLSTFLPVTANGIFAVLIFLAATNLRIISEIGDTSGNLIFWSVSHLFRLLLPIGEVNDLVQNILLVSNNPDAEPAFEPHTWIFLYELVYIAILLGGAILIFRRKDLRQA
jgi:ABC-type transport system involved in multi-copper enzyme maturation permease subunit